MYSVLKGQHCPIHYKRHVFTSDHTAYPGSFAVDFVTQTPTAPDKEDSKLPPRTTFFSEDEFNTLRSDDDTPVLIALHGLSGGSYELYLRHVLYPLTGEEEVARSGRPWQAIVVNSRGCARSKLTSGFMFNAKSTWDIRQVVAWARRTWPNRPLYGVGFSLGANIITNYVGEEGDKCELKAVVAISSPWNLEAGSLALQRTWIGREIYSKTLATNLKKVFSHHLEEIRQNPDVDVEKVLATTYLHEFDRELQGPTWGYPTEGAYYRDAASTDPLLAVRIPFFTIHAEDDPVAPKEVLPIEETRQNPYAVLCTTTMGGHLSWFEWGGGRWYVKPAVGFLRRMAEEVDFAKLRSDSFHEKPVGVDRLRGKPRFDPVRRKLYLED